MPIRLGLALLLAAVLAGGGCESRGPRRSEAMARASVSPMPIERMSVTPALFGIGGDESDKHTHVSFVTPKKLVRAQVHVVVDKTADVGLNFFAIQVNFDNDTWAHGGVQDVSGPKSTRTRQVNWGGLVDRGGGNDDYDKENDVSDLEKMQNPPEGQHLGPYQWKNGIEYEYIVERGKKITLPPGDYRFFPKHAVVHVDHDRTMWEWRFTVRPVGSTDANASFVATLYDAAETFHSIYVWNESGAGSTAAGMHTSWSMPTYRTSKDSTKDLVPESWKRF
jgi:hypothetical protein